MKLLVFDIETYKEHFVFVGSMLNSETREEIYRLIVTEDKAEIKHNGNLEYASIFGVDNMALGKAAFNTIEAAFKEADYIISYNGKTFDLPVLAKMSQDLQKTDSIPVKYIYGEAQSIINYDEHNNRLNRRPAYRMDWHAKHFDLFANCLLRGSLKQWEMYENQPIRELPYAPDAMLSSRMKKEIEDYCEHDVTSTVYIFWRSAWDGVAGGGSGGVLNTLPAQQVLLEWWPKNLPFVFDRSSQSIGAGVIYGTNKPIPPKTNQPLKHFNLNDFDVPLDLKVIIGYMAKNRDIDNLDTTYRNIKYGRGGCHFMKPGVAKDVWAFDFASLYPTIICNWKLLKTPQANENYAKIVHDRLEFKKHKKDSIRAFNLDRGAKLLLNAPTGAMRIRSGKGTMCDPAAGEAMCYIGQLIISELALSLPEPDNLIEVNTDSVFVKGEANRKHCESMIEHFKKKFNLILEPEYMPAIYARDVNNYIMYDENGNVKSGKGIAYSDMKNKQSEMAVYDTLFKALLTDKIDDSNWKNEDWKRFIVKYHKASSSKYATIGDEPMQFKNYYFLWTTRECPNSQSISFSRDLIDRHNGAIKARYGIWAQDIKDLEYGAKYIDFEQYRRDLDVELDLWGKPELITTHLTKDQRKPIRSMKDLIVGDYI